MTRILTAFDVIDDELTSSQIANSRNQEELVEILDLALFSSSCDSGEMVTEVKRWLGARAQRSCISL